MRHFKYKTWLYFSSEVPSTLRHLSYRLISFKKPPRKIQGLAYGRSFYFCVNFLEVGTINGKRYCDDPVEIKRQFGKSYLGFSDQAFCCWMIMRDHTRRRQTKIILQLLVGSAPFTIIPDLAPSDFNLFPSLKKNLAGRHFGSNAEVKQAVKRIFRRKSPEFFTRGLFKVYQAV
ncbi:histone-lysine N-methyltransferase SETMAR [Trichonephila clavipes]|nr:histone-lysine N-methyltransferase SETMAR [Trichonephila clavipes]